MSSGLVTWDWNDVFPLRHHPGQGQLRRRGVLCFGKLFELRKQRDVPFEILCLKSRVAATPVALRQIFCAMDNAGEETASERRISHEAHIEIAASANIAG